MTDTRAIDIVLESHGARGRYVTRFEGGLEAEMTFTRSAGLMTIDHTGVPPALEGRGVAAALVQRAIADARTGGFKIKPLCSYVAAQFQRHKDWADLLG